MKSTPVASPANDFSPSQAFHLSRPILASLVSLASLLLVVASPLSGVYLLETVVLTRVDSGGRERWDRGGVGFWGGCVRDGDSFLSQSCSLALPLPSLFAPPPTAFPSTLPSFQTLLPPMLSATLALALCTTFVASLAAHVVNSYILWGSLSELGRPEGSVMPLTPAGRLRFGEGRWRRKWRERVRKVGLVGVGSCAVACAVILYPLLPTFYIPSSFTPAAPPPNSSSPPASSMQAAGRSGRSLALDEDIPVSVLLTPSWGLGLLVLAGALMVHSKDSRGLRHGRRGSSLNVITAGLGGREKRRARGSSVEFNLSHTTSPLTSPSRTSPLHSPLSGKVMAPTPRRASHSVPWIDGAAMVDDVEGEGGESRPEGVETEGEDDEREVWTWTKEV